MITESSLFYHRILIGLLLCAVVVLNMLTRSVAAVPLRDGSGNVLQDYAFTPNAETDSTLLSFG